MYLLSIGGLSAVNFKENSTDPVAAYTAVDPERDSYAWALDRDRRESLQHRPRIGGKLSFKKAPNYEDPQDVDS